MGEGGCGSMRVGDGLKALCKEKEKSFIVEGPH